MNLGFLLHENSVFYVVLLGTTAFEFDLSSSKHPYCVAFTVQPILATHSLNIIKFSQKSG